MNKIKKSELRKSYYIQQECKNCNNKNNKLIKFKDVDFSKDKNKLPHLKELCFKCNSGYFCQKYI